MNGAARNKWSLTQEAFDGLLAGLDTDRDTAAQKYLEMRRNLVRLFEWRGCSTPDEYADETINRCARKMGDGEVIRDIATYSIGVARMLLREIARDRGRKPVPLEQAPELRSVPDQREHVEARIECLRSCLTHLSNDNRNLILRYYHGDKGEKIKNRKMLTELFGIPSNILRMRALRVREKLHLCTQKCLRGHKDSL